MGNSMKTSAISRRVLATITLALTVLLLSSTAAAQGRSNDARRKCDQNQKYRDLVYSYLTGKKQSSSKDRNLLTRGRKRLKINGPALTLSTSINPVHKVMTGAAVSIPFTAVKSYAKLSFELINGKDTDIMVCQYALKSSAGWAKFKPRDLRAIHGRHLSRFGNRTPVSVRVGKKRPPRGYRTSTVLLIDVLANWRYSTKRTLKNLRLKTSR